MVLSNTISRFVKIVFSIDEQFVPYQLDATHSGLPLRVDHSLNLVGASEIAHEFYSKILFESSHLKHVTFPLMSTV